eukprot:4539152-Pyramimonas_sp.AAC.1
MRRGRSGAGFWRVRIRRTASRWSRALSCLCGGLEELHQKRPKGAFNYVSMENAMMAVLEGNQLGQATQA